MSYLVFPRVRVQAANMLSASFLMGGPPVFAAYGLGEALCFHLGGGAKVTGMAITVRRWGNLLTASFRHSNGEPPRSHLISKHFLPVRPPLRAATIPRRTRTPFPCSPWPAPICA